ncbi:hypothetical protein ACFWFF_31945 [Streptomyces sp. NPDC060223]|uniref:hypothetical protein n=1 Tax=unclassified Streptomyces TaxID=2593676 RepID=UPI00363CA513
MRTVARTACAAAREPSSVRSRAVSVLGTEPSSVRSRAVSVLGTVESAVNSCSLRTPARKPQSPRVSPR